MKHELRVMKTMARQGDVLIISSKHLKLRPETKERLFKLQMSKEWTKQDGLTTPLAYGEVTGHAHAFKDQTKIKLTYNQDIQETVKHLSVLKDTMIEHQEHDAISVPVSDNVVLIQNEERLGEIKRVVD